MPAEALVGTEANFAGNGTRANRQIAKEKSLCVKVKVTKGGTINKFTIWTGSSTPTASTFECFVLKDSAGKPGAVIAACTGSGMTTKETKYEAATVVTEGTVITGEEVWIGCTNITAAGINSTWAEVTTGGAQTWISKGLHKKVSEVTEWDADTTGGEKLPVNQGQFDICALGTKSPQIEESRLKSGISSPAPSVKREALISSSAGKLGISQTQPTNASLTVAGGGKIPLSKMSMGVLAYSPVARRAEITSILSMGLGGLAELTTGAVKLNVYYGPVGEEAAEKAKLESEIAGGGAIGKRYINIFPGTATGTSPTVIFVPGGGWAKSQWKETKPEAEALALKGMVVFHMDYRHTTESSAATITAEEVEDVEAVINYAIAHTAAYGGSATKICLLGASAGGHLVAIAAVKMNNAAGTLVVKKVSMLSGIPDLEEFVEEIEAQTYVAEADTKNQVPLEKNIQAYLHQNIVGPQNAGIAGAPNSTEGAARTKQAAYSPTRLTSSVPCRYQVFQFEKDLIPKNQYTKFIAKLLAEGHLAQEHLIPGAGHAMSAWPLKDPVVKVKDQIAEFFLAPEIESVVRMGIHGSTSTKRESAIVSSVKVGISARSTIGRALTSTMALGIGGSAAISRSSGIVSSLAMGIRTNSPVSRIVEVRSVLRSGISGFTATKSNGVIQISRMSLGFQGRSPVRREARVNSTMGMGIRVHSTQTSREALGIVYASVQKPKRMAVTVEYV